MRKLMSQLGGLFFLAMIAYPVYHFYQNNWSMHTTWMDFGLIMMGIIGFFGVYTKWISS